MAETRGEPRRVRSSEGTARPMQGQMAAVPTIFPTRTRKLRLLLVFALASVLLTPSRARADVTFQMFGSGNGHGVGLSQWGAYGLAGQGWTSTEILTHFFTGTT